MVAFEDSFHEWKQACWVEEKLEKKWDQNWKQALFCSELSANLGNPCM